MAELRPEAGPSRCGATTRRAGDRPEPSPPEYRVAMKGDRVEVVVDTGHGTQTFEIVATRAGRRIEITSARGVIEVSEVTRTGAPIRTGRFMANRVVALVEHPAQEAAEAGVEIETRRRLGVGRGRARTAAAAQLPLLADDVAGS
jgi:hypothetical protein